MARRGRIEGNLIYRKRATVPKTGVTVYAYWRDSAYGQHMRVIGPAWAKRHGDRWRKWSSMAPEGYFTPEDAARVMRKLIDEHEAKIERDSGVIDPDKATVEHAAWAWLDYGQTVAGWKPSTVRYRRSTIRVHLIPAFGSKPIAKLTQKDVRDWWRGLHSAKRSGGRLSDRNANKVLAELRALLTWAQVDYGLTSNVAAPDGKHLRKHRELTSERPDFYSVEEIEALVRAAAGAQDALIFRTAAFAGLRRGELVSLRWRHIDFPRSLIHVVENVSAGVDARVKDSEGRTVPLAPSLAEALAASRTATAVDSDLVFPGSRRRGKDGVIRDKLDGDALSERYRAARDRAGLRPLRFHDLRHTFGSLAVDRGASLVQVQAWMGHSDIKTTMRYLHSKSRAEDAALLEAAFTVGAVEQVDRELRGSDDRTIDTCKRWPQRGLQSLTAA